MPMIPAGIIEKPTPVTQVIEGEYALTPDGFIDNKAETNKAAQMVADILDQEIDVNDPVFCSGLYMLIGNMVGYKFADISKFSGMPRRFCRMVGFNLHYSRLIRMGKISGDLVPIIESGEAADQFEAIVIFTLYCLAGAGRIMATRNGKGDYRWGAVDGDPYIYRIRQVTG